MLDLLMWGFWLALAAYLSWFLFRAKTFQPLSLDDLALSWKLHKNQTGCKTSCIHTLLVRNNEVVGFKCECGYDYLQKRLITQKVHTCLEKSIAPLGFPKIGNLLETKYSLEKVGICYLNIKRIR